MPNRDRMGDIVAMLAGNAEQLEPLALQWADKVCELDAEVERLNLGYNEACRVVETLESQIEAARAEGREQMGDWCVEWLTEKGAQHTADALAAAIRALGEGE